MIRSIQKIIRIGSSGGVTIPAKELKRQDLSFGDEVEVTVRPLRTTSEDKAVLEAAQKILTAYHTDFENLADR